MLNQGFEVPTILVPANVLYSLILIPIFFVVEIISLRIGLKIVKARDRKGFKWVTVSFFIQIGILMFVLLPIILRSISEGLDFGDTDYVTFFIIIGLVIDYNIINVIHKLGFKRTIIVFIFFVVPFAIFGSIIGFSLF